MKMHLKVIIKRSVAQLILSKKIISSDMCSLTKSKKIFDTMIKIGKCRDIYNLFSFDGKNIFSYNLKKLSMDIYGYDETSLCKIDNISSTYEPLKQLKFNNILHEYVINFIAILKNNRNWTAIKDIKLCF